MLTYDMHNYAASQAATQHTPPPTFTKSSRLNEKYSLRQRDKRKCTNNDIYSHSNEPQTYIPDNNNNNNNNNNSMHLMKATTNTEIDSNPLLTTYRTKRACLAPATTTIKHAKVSPKTKTKAAPLSKYRRKTANARERTRMREINTAFEQLRHCVPPTIIGEDPNSTNEKLTKITTLRLAMKYIQTLSQALENPAAEKELLEELELAGDLRFRLSALEFQQTQQEQEEPQNDFIVEKKIPLTNKITKSTQKTKSIGKNKGAQTKTSQKLKKTGIKTNKMHKYKNADTNSALSPASTSSAYSSQYSNASFSSTASTISETSNTSSVYDNGNVMDMKHMLLESDGESLHLSEHCLSPLSAQNSHNLFNSTTLGNHFTNFDTSMGLSTLENPLELSLRLLDPTVTDQQQPSACISPLSSLDTLPPYCDLLSVDFPEHSTLDMFLT